jgi:uncharacterized tellurite resistance protein B-like protein
MEKITISADLQAQFLRLYQIAMTDGDFSPLEWKMLYDFAAERNVSKEELDKVLLSPVGKLEIPQQLEEKIDYLYDFSRMIWADGIVTEDEEVTLKKYCKRFGFLEENIPQLAQYFIDAVKNGKSKESIIEELTK